MKNKIIAPGKGEYGILLGQIAEIITGARAKVIRDLDTTQAHAYWFIGKAIIEHEQGGNIRADYGKQTLFILSRDLTANFGKGFSVDNLENMRRFYAGFPDLFKKSETVSRILSWSHYCELLKEDDLNARAFYEIEAIGNGWSMRELRRQMDSMLYERLCLSKNKKKVKELSRKG